MHAVHLRPVHADRNGMASPVYPIVRVNRGRRIAILVVPLLLVLVAIAGLEWAPSIPGLGTALTVATGILIVLWIMGTWQVAWRVEITATQVTVWPVWRPRRTLARSDIARARPTASALMLTGRHRFRGRVQVPSNRLLGLDDELRSIAALWPAAAA
jgi:hypothetical protein